MDGADPGAHPHDPHRLSQIPSHEGKQSRSPGGTAVKAPLYAQARAQTNGPVTANQPET